jgi:predicted regulator of Ras-like GTPase activity (Roadblock/LC7/MglB family)
VWQKLAFGRKVLITPELSKMDFQSLFKRKQEGPAPGCACDDTGEALKERDVILREGELLDGHSPAPLDWSKVGGAITVKAGKILGVLEGRTRIKAEVLEELYPGKFARPGNPAAEFNIPLHVVVMQIQDILCSTSLSDVKLEGLETPFAELAREDEERFKKGQRDQPLGGQTVLPRSLDESGNGVREDIEGQLVRSEQPEPAIARLGSAPEAHKAPSRIASPPSEGRQMQSRAARREGYERLQELYLTDESIDGAKVADWVCQLPRVTGALIMLADGAVLGGELGGEIGEKLASLAPSFVKHASSFTEILAGGPTRFITFFGHALQISLVRCGSALMLVGHEGKNLPPGLRERLVATAQALDLLYGPQS